MLSITGHPRHACNGVPRRELLRIAGAGLFGLSLPEVLAAEASADVLVPKAKSVVFLMLFGGPSQLETFDLKPHAPDKIRGPFRPIACRTPDLLIGEHLPLSAAVSDKFAVVRTMSHSFNDHSGGGHYLQTGRRWHVPIGGGFSPTPKDWPSMGSVVEYVDQSRERVGKSLSFLRRVAEHAGTLTGSGTISPSRRACRLAGSPLQSAHDADR